MTIISWHPEEVLMDRAVVTVKGQIVIPSKLRRKFGIKKGTQVYVYERDGEIAIKPITDDYIRNMAGMTGTKVQGGSKLPIPS